VPKLWSETIDAHRREVREAILETTINLAENDGLLSLTMSRIAEETGIGRATLYKYFADVESILNAWHERQISHHLEHLKKVSYRSSDASERLRDVLHAYAFIVYGSRSHRDSELAAALHPDPQVASADHELRQLLLALLKEARATGSVRDDVSAGELVSFCVSSLSSAHELGSNAAIKRLVGLTWDGIAS
jgi:AcrR family transcriptional regulator